MEGGKPEYPEKNPRSTGENQQTLLTYHAGSGNRTRAIVVRGERSHRCATCAPSVLEIQLVHIVYWIEIWKSKSEVRGSNVVEYSFSQRFFSSRIARWRRKFPNQDGLRNSLGIQGFYIRKKPGLYTDKSRKVWNKTLEYKISWVIWDIQS